MITRLGALTRTLAELDREGSRASVPGLAQPEPGDARTTAVSNPVTGLLLVVSGDHGQHTRTTIGVAAAGCHLLV